MPESLQSKYNALKRLYLELTEKFNSDEKRIKWKDNPLIHALCKCGSEIQYHVICEKENCKSLVCPNEIPKVCRNIYCIKDRM